ncbi:accessory gene regulator B family protein [Bengtsoniella intestinalis]|uniref:accessory gene regulator ArgB-like protein n=1 Tax=Bengtsoniella intestinalis TaxID=3073143 RepID=UPI00391EE4CF
MLSRRLEDIADFLVSNGKNANVDRDIILYGLTVAIEQAASIVSAIILGCVVGLGREVVIFLISFSLLRTYAGGYHCKTAIQCYFMSVGTIFAVLMIVKYTPQKYIMPICIMLLLVAVPLIWKLAPVGATSKPLDEVEKQHYRKITIRNLVVECFIISILLLAGIYNFAFVMSLGIMVTAGVVVLQRKIKN